MPYDDESPDPLENLLADWFAGAMLTAQRPPDVEDESAYATELALLADARERARTLARMQCAQLFARLERRAAERRYSPAQPARRSAPRAREYGTMRGGPRFELSI